MSACSSDPGGGPSGCASWSPPTFRGSALLGLLVAFIVAAGGARAADPPASAGPADLTATAEAPGVRLTLSLDRARLLIDDRLRLSLRVEGSRELALELPSPPDRLGPFAVVGHERAAPRLAGEADMVWDEVLVLQPEDFGDLTLPEVAITFRRAGGTIEERLAVQPPPVTITSVLPADADVTRPRDIGPPAELPPASVPRAVWLVGLPAAALVMATLLFFRRRGSGHRDLAPPTVQALAEPDALAELEALERADLITAGRIAELYHRLADILRRHTQQLSGVEAGTRTTEELLACVTTRGGPINTCRDLLGDMLADCDRVKFARHQPTAEAARSLCARARDFVERTTVPASAPSST